MYEISVSGRFIASHQLRLSDGSLEPRHEHEWRVRVAFAGPNLDASGMLVDFNDVKPRLDQLLGILFNRNLNALPAFRARQPSAENVARHIADQLGDLLPAGVRLLYAEVEETPGCAARFRPSLS